MPFPHLPKPIYEVLPALYVVGGLSSAFWSNNVVGVVAGLLLSVAGWHVRVMRQRARADHAAQQARLEARLRRSRKADMRGAHQ